jgi:nucleotide-binding universal stress UspA family protein
MATARHRAGRKPAKRSRRTSAPARKPRPASRKRPPVQFGIRTILVPIDFSVHSRNALKYAVPLAEKFGAALRLVYVVEPTIYPADLGFGQVVLPGVEEELREKGEDELRTLIEREIGARVRSSSVVRSGNPHQEILREAEEAGVELIVVATHGHSGVEHMLFGSTAERIVRRSPVPVLIIRPQAAPADEG